eukprot:g6060.t1
MVLDFEDLNSDKVSQIGLKLAELTHEGVDALQHELPAENIVELFKNAIQILKTEPTVLDLDFLDVEIQVTVVGDTHGQFHDVLKMFEVAGVPSNQSTFILNGDFVDRGAWGLETLILFLCWKLILPQSVYLLRGNHESQSLTELYGYKTEVQAKYDKVKSKSIYSISKKLFAVLPLAAVIQQNTLVLHGGLFRATPRRTGRKRKKAPRIKEQSIQLGTVDFLRTCSKGGLEPTRMKVSRAIADVLWSDPMNEEGIKENSERGLGLTFGPDVTAQFLEANDLKLIIRSHEGPDARQFRNGMSDMMTGYSIDHETKNGNLVTVFSAPDYPQFQIGDERTNNTASVVVLKAPDYATPDIIEFSAVLPRPAATVYYDMELYVETDVDFNEREEQEEETCKAPAKSEDQEESADCSKKTVDDNNESKSEDQST